MRRHLTLLAIVAIVAANIELPLLRLVLFQYRLLSQQRADKPPWYPDYPRFLEVVRARTRPGDRIAIVVPSTRWDGGYAYAYYRASYLLAGREVLPVITPRDRFVRENFLGASHVAWWGREPAGPKRPVVFQANDGILLGR